jgi:hypothetical protein
MAFSDIDSTVTEDNGGYSYKTQLNPNVVNRKKKRG